MPTSHARRRNPLSLIDALASGAFLFGVEASILSSNADILLDTPQ